MNLADRKITPVGLDGVDRQILRAALTLYADGLEKSIKSDDKLGLDTEDASTRLAIIHGEEGMGRALMARLSGEYVPPIDAVQGDLLAATSPGESETSIDEFIDEKLLALRDRLLEQDAFPAGRYADYLLSILRGWSDVECDAVAWWLDPAAAPPNSVPLVPNVVTHALQRVREFLLSDETIAAGAEAGPWTLGADVYGESNVRFYFAEQSNQAPAVIDDDTAARFTDESLAIRRVAWLNLQHVNPTPRRLVVPEDEPAEQPA